MSARKRARNPKKRTGKSENRPYPFLPVKFVRDGATGRTVHRTGRSFWSVTTTGSYTDDIEIGQRHALELLARLSKPINADQYLLGWAVFEMIAKHDLEPQTRGVIVGFFETLSLALEVFAEGGYVLQGFGKFITERREKGRKAVEAATAN